MKNRKETLKTMEKLSDTESMTFAALDSLSKSKILRE
jgi:hypothetical protein